MSATRMSARHSSLITHHSSLPSWGETMQSLIHRCFGWTLVMTLGLVAPVRAQAPRSSDRAGAEGSAAAIDSRRRTEIQIELAWLSDPVTFACMLEARVDGP